MRRRIKKEKMEKIFKLMVFWKGGGKVREENLGVK